MTQAAGFSSLAPLLAVLVSLAAVPLILASGRRPNLREFWTLAAAFIKFGLVLSLLPNVLAGREAVVVLLEISPGIRLALRADAFAVFFALVASGLWILTSFFSIGYVRGLADKRQTRYFAAFAVCLSATMGVAFAANLLTFIVFYEILTVATYPLVIHKETPVAIRAGRKYLAYTLTAGVFLVAAAVVTFQTAGTLDFQPGGIPAFAGVSTGTLRALFVLFMAGVGVKAAIMPLHSWLPTAMAAPTPVSALLHAVAVVKSGVFGVVRVVGFVFGPALMRDLGLNGVLAVFAATTIIAASLLAFRQDNLKLRLAYSTVAHLSYIILGAALLSGGALTGSVLHLAFHATLKITLFFCAGAIYVNLHRENVSELDGIGRVMPWTMGAFTAAAVGLSGVPPLNGFVSKWWLGWGAIEAGSVLPVAVLALSGLLNAGYLLPIARRAFLRPATGLEGKGEASPFMVVPLVLAGAVSLLFGLLPDLFFRFHDLARAVAAGILGGAGP